MPKMKGPTLRHVPDRVTPGAKPLFDRIADALSRVVDPADRNQLAMDLFGIVRAMTPIPLEPVRVAAEDWLEVPIGGGWIVAYRLKYGGRPRTARITEVRVLPE